MSRHEAMYLALVLAVFVLFSLSLARATIEEMHRDASKRRGTPAHHPDPHPPIG